MSIRPATTHPGGVALLPSPERGFVSSQPASIWEEGLICGNGRIGVNALSRPTNDHHRHASQLYALFGGMPEEIAGSPELCSAFRKSIEFKLEHYWQNDQKGIMSFGLVQLGQAAASLGHGELAYRCLTHRVNSYWLNNLASMHNHRSLFRDPPIEARPGAFWDWLNGSVDLAEITRELEEMKAKGMSGAEIWDIGVIRPNPEEPIPAGPAFLGPESLQAIDHAITEADRLGLHLGLIASSSWNAGGAWIEPRDAMKGLYQSVITVNGPTRLSQLLPFPSTPAPKGNRGLPVYYQDIAVLAFPRTTNQVIRDPAAVLNLSERMNSDGWLTWDVPDGAWVITRFITSNTGQQLVDAESFTGWRHWQDGPLEYKRLADTAFCAGLNRLTFHTFAHTPLPRTPWAPATTTTSSIPKSSGTAWSSRTTACSCLMA